MGTLGQYLHDARVAKDLDLREAAQQTRISLQYLKALENEDFSKLPGEVFVKGFLKNYGRFLNLDESEIMKRYSELKPEAASPAASVSVAADRTVVSAEREAKKETPLEPFAWAAVIIISLLVFLFTSLPIQHSKNAHQLPAVPAVPAVAPQEGKPAPVVQPDKLYLEVDAVEDTWLLVRTDASPQKKAVLKKGESLIWSADERFLLSYGRVGDVKLLLNGEELVVQGTKETAVRDMAVTRTGIVNQPSSAKTPQLIKRKPQQPPVSSRATHTQAEAKPAVPAQPSVSQTQAETKPAVPTQPSPAPTPPAAPFPRTPLAPAQ